MEKQTHGDSTFSSHNFSQSVTEDGKTNNGQQSRSSKLTFDVISDFQLTDTGEVSQKKVRNALKDLHELNPDTEALIVNGDIINDGRAESYRKVREILDQYPHPVQVYFSIGNHEFFKDDGNINSINRFLDFAGIDEVYYDKEVNGYSFIFLGTESWGPIGTSVKDSAILSRNQLLWLKETLVKQENSDKPIFVFLHHPLPYSFYGTDIDFYKHSVIQDKELTTILTDYPQVIFFSGHTHWDLRDPNMFINGKFTQVSTGAVWNSFGPDGSGGETIRDDNASSGLHVNVYDDRVIINGRDFANKQWIDEYRHTIMNPGHKVSGLALTTQGQAGGKSIGVQLSFTNKGSSLIINIQLSLNVLFDWEIKAESKTYFKRVEPGETVKATWEVVPDGSASSGAYPIDGRADFVSEEREIDMTTNETIEVY